jgi:zinc transporter 1/2/3
VAFKKLGIHPFIVIIGKCAGAGVILAVSLVHMLLPANDSLTSPCAPVVFNTDYGAYAFLFAMIAAILMHFWTSSGLNILPLAKGR